MLTLKYSKTALTALALMTSFSLFAGPPVYSTLKSSRAKIQLPHYSVEQKKLVLSQARLVLEEIYVHQEIKTKDFGPEANPTPYLNNIEKQITTITDLEFHKQLSEIFFRLRDLHTLYYLPKPFACYESFLPFRLKEVRASDGRQVIAVSEVGDDEQMLKLLPKSFKLKLGDILTRYDGLSVEAAIKTKSAHSLGANASADRRKSIEDLKYSQHNLELLPANDTVKLEFQDAEGEKYKTELPWVVLTDWDCITESNTHVDEIPVGLRLKPLNKLIKKIHKPSKTRGEMPLGHTKEPVLYWNIINSIHGNFGYVELSSFTPDVMSLDEVVNTIKGLLQNELKNTEGLIFEMRGNTGGQLPLAERLVQFFSPREVQPNTFFLKNSPANMFYMNTYASLDPFTEALNLANSLGQPYTAHLPIDSFEQINDMGQVYFKPVAVFVNSNCYSACETFASQMQDHQIGTVFGEDQATGGGGANTYSLNEIIDDFGGDNGPFKKLPNGQNISFAFREAFRGGVYDGIHIENMGVKSDRISAPSMSDLFNATNDQLLVLQKFLKSESPKFTSKIMLANEERMDFVLNKRGQFKATWIDTTALDFKMDGKVIETRAIAKSANNALISLPTTIATNKVTQGRLDILGYNEAKPVWRKVLNYRVVPESKIISLNQILKVNLNQAGDLALYTHNTLAKNGWNISDDSLYLGNGSSYVDMSHAEASLFVTLPKANYQLNFDATIKTESLDPMKVIAVYKGKEIVLLDNLSGDLPLANYTADLAQFSGKAIEIRFVFQSDPETTDKGITIKNISLTPRN